VHKEILGRDSDGRTGGTFGEAELVRRAKTGETEAFLELVKQFDRCIYRVARQITLNPVDAESVLLQTFLKAYGSMEHCPEDANLNVWLVTIAVQEALLELAGKELRPASMDAANQYDDMAAREVTVWQGDPQKRYTRQEFARILDQAMECLEPLYRAVFVLRDIEEMSLEDTSRALKLRVPMVKERLLRARLLLSAELTRRFHIR
jgi:RNA polymerase sigma-70 factor, ECF subfamily